MRCRSLPPLLATTAFLIAVPMEAQTSPASADSELGKLAFSTCAVCHGLDGQGGEHAPNIATDPKIQRLSDAALGVIVRNGIPAEGMPSFRKLWKEEKIGAVLQYLRTLQRTNETAVQTGNAEKGSELFFGRTGCSTCHMIDGRGTFFATDLSGYGSNHNATGIRQAIVSPDQNLDPRKGTVLVLTRTAKHYRGEVRNEDNFTIQMQTADGSFHLFDKSDLVQVQHESTSSMHADSTSKLTSSDLDDLVSFLSQAKNGDKPAPDNDDQE